MIVDDLAGWDAVDHHFCNHRIASIYDNMKTAVETIFVVRARL